MRDNGNMKWRIALLSSFVMWMAFGSGLPVASAKAASPELVKGAMIYERSDDEFASAIVIDPATGKRLYAYLPDKKWTAASLTKLTNALVLLDQKPRWSKTIAYSSKDSVGGGELSLKSGTQITIQDLFYSSIVASANNAAMALARTSGLGVDGFVKKMNAKAKSLGLTTTKFYDPVGMDPRNVTTAAEMAVIAGKAFSTPAIQKAATTMTYRFATSNPTVKKTITSTDHLLTRDDTLYVLGGKTGFLYESRYNFVVKMRPMDADPAKPPLLIVVLGSPTYEGSFNAAKGLANWAWKAYTWASK